MLNELRDDLKFYRNDPEKQKLINSVRSFDASELRGVYEIYLDDRLIPQTPSKITWEYPDENETIRLANQGNLTIPRTDSPIKISFDMVCTSETYPFTYDVTYVRKKWTDFLWEIKSQRKPVNFEVVRKGNYTISRPGDGIFSVSMKVLIADWSFVEDAEQNDDFIISITLLQYFEQKNLEINSDVQHHLIQNRRARGWTEIGRGQG